MKNNKIKTLENVANNAIEGLKSSLSPEMARYLERVGRGVKFIEDIVGGGGLEETPKGKLLSAYNSWLGESDIEKKMRKTLRKERFYSDIGKLIEELENDGYIFRKSRT